MFPHGSSGPLCVKKDHFSRVKTVLSYDNVSSSKVRAVLPCGNIRPSEANKDKYHMITSTKIKFNLFHGRQVYSKIVEYKSMLASHILYSINLQYTDYKNSCILCRGMITVKAIPVLFKTKVHRSALSTM